MTKREKRLMTILNGCIKHANLCGGGTKTHIPPASQFAWRAVARQMENLRKRFQRSLTR